MSRIPIRLRLTLVFALAMAVVLTALGAFLYVRLEHTLEEQVDDGLRQRAVTASTLVRELGPEAAGDALGVGGDEQFTQVFAADGSLAAASPSSFTDPVVDLDDLRRSESGDLLMDTEKIALFDDHAGRVLVTSVDVDGEPVTVVLGASLEDAEDSLAGLLTALLIVGPIALVVASLAGYGVAAAALRPVDAMRRKAMTISADTAAGRLPLPGAKDEVYRLGATLNEMLERLDAGLERERRFVADASHELRTPLALLRAELELAERRSRSPEELEQTLRSVAEDVGRLSRLAEDLLVLARADDGKLGLHRESISVSELFDGVERLFGPRASEQGRRLELDGPPDATVDVDRLRLEQALGNLVDNALRYGAGAVTLTAREDDGSIVIRVADEGDGFPTAYLPAAFERFSRAETARSSHGAGLGLAIVAAVAEAHGGRASAANAPGGGATVSLSLPVASG